MGVKWRDELATGVGLIDSQHKELFDKVNNLYDACAKGTGKEEVEKVIKFLGDYVVKHFGAEEEIQRKHSYPGYEIHKSQHEQFIKDFTEFKAKIERDGVSGLSVILINRVIADWLVKHIGETDKALGEYLKGKI